MAKIQRAYKAAVKCKQEFEEFKQDDKVIEDYMESYKKV